MLVLWAVEWIVTVAFFAGMFTQVVLPLWNGTKLFPAVRRRKLHGQTEAAAEDVDNVREAIHAAELERDGRLLRRKLHEIDGEGR